MTVPAGSITCVTVSKRVGMSASESGLRIRRPNGEITRLSRKVAAMASIRASSVLSTSRINCREMIVDIPTESAPTITNTMALVVSKSRVRRLMMP